MLTILFILFFLLLFINLPVGFAIGLSKSLIVLHTDDHQHALKEIDASASAVASNIDEVVKILQYTCTSKI